MPRGFKGVLDNMNMVWNGVEFGLLSNGSEAARVGDSDAAKRKGIVRIWDGIGGVWRNAGYDGRDVRRIIGMVIMV